VFAENRNSVDQLTESLTAEGFTLPMPFTATARNPAGCAACPLQAAECRSGRHRLAARGPGYPTPAPGREPNLRLVAEGYIHRIGRTGRAGASARGCRLVKRR